MTAITDLTPFQLRKLLDLEIATREMRSHQKEYHTHRQHHRATDAGLALNRALDAQARVDTLLAALNLFPEETHTATTQEQFIS